MMRLPIRSVATLALVSALATCVAAARADDGFEINAILPLTGSGAALGTKERDALHTLEVRVNGDGGVNGRQIHFAVSDDQSNPRTAVQLASALIAKHVAIILGSSSSGLCAAIMPLVKDGPLLYCFSSAIRPEPNGYVFSSGFSTRDLLLVSIRYLHARGLTRVGVVTASDAAGAEAERSIDEAVGLRENRGMQIVARERFDPGDVSAAAQMTRLKTSGAQVVVAWSAGAPFGMLLRSANEAGLALPILTSNDNLTYAQMKQSAGFLPPELLFPAGAAYAGDDIADKATRESVEAYRAEFSQQGIRPDNGQSRAWDPAMLLMSAMRKLGPTATAAQLRGYFNDQRGWTGINGDYNFRVVPQRGLGPGGVVIVRWDKAQDTWTGASRPGGRPLP
jgi:branched-chain amino acid transport system substrate-binding protein